MIISNKVFFCKNVVLNNGYKDDRKTYAIMKNVSKIECVYKSFNETKYIFFDKIR